MKRQLIIRSFVGLAMCLAAVSLALAQCGGYGWGYGGYGGYGMGHGWYGGYGGYGIGHGYGHYGGYGGYGYLYPRSDFYASPRYYGHHDDGAASSESAYAKQSQPSPTPYVVAKPVTTSEGSDYQRRAEGAFRAGDFKGAARLANHALLEMPHNGRILLFSAQTLFAVGDYRRAAEAVHHAASLLSSEHLGYVVENYRRYYRGRAYVDQMDRLNEYIQENPNASYAYFLRGYQHAFLGHQKSALRDLNLAVELESRDQLAAQLIERFGGMPPAVHTADLGEPPAAEEGGHEGHDHGSHGSN